MTKIEIIEETAKYYTGFNRSISKDGNCLYKNDAGNMCAVGRCLREDSNVFIQHNEAINADMLELENNLKPQYQGHTSEFWMDLQKFHDNAFFWNDLGMSQKGIEFYEKLKLKYV